MEQGSTPAPTRDEERMRRRFARRQWARRWGFWRPLLVCLTLLVVVGLGVWTLWFSTLLGVDEVEVTGTDHLGPAEVVAAAEIEEGSPLLRLDTNAVVHRVEALAPVRSASVSRALDGTVTIQVVERETVAVASIGGRLSGLDRDGVAFRRFATKPRDVPEVKLVGDVDAEALAEAAQVIGSLTGRLAQRVRWVEVESLDHITLVTKGGRTVLWGSGDDSRQKAKVLAALLKASKDEHLDVSVPGQPVTSPR